MSLLVRRIVLPTFLHAFHGRSHRIGTCPKKRVHFSRKPVRTIARTELNTLISLLCRGLIVKDSLRRYCEGRLFVSTQVPRVSLTAIHSGGKLIRGNAIDGPAIG